jgi:pyridinium-3,5-biscarboxylic acid mononucleotide sulfurtransferase
MPLNILQTGLKSNVERDRDLPLEASAVGIGENGRDRPCDGRHLDILICAIFMSMDGWKKYDDLKEVLRGLGRILICFSGGVDSTFLLKAAVDAVGKDNVLALIARSESYPEQEFTAARNFADSLGVPCEIVQTSEMSDEKYLVNAKDRCYHCKRHLFSVARSVAHKRGFPHVAEGSNVDDQGDYRPGRRAGLEAGVVSPLLGVGYTKSEIRDVSQELGLSTFKKPSMACLASRIPYGTRIATDVLKRIEKSEGFLKELGLTQVRVRYHGNIARIEVVPQEFDSVLPLREQIAEGLQKMGFLYVTLDLKGYRTGSLNEALDNRAP